MQSDPLLGILSNIDTICQSAITDFSDDNDDEFHTIQNKIQSIRSCEQQKICNRIADLCTNVVICVSPGNAEFKSQVYSLVTSVTNMIKVYESLIIPSVERNSNSTSENIALEQSENECRELKSKVSQLEKQIKSDGYTIFELRNKTLEFDTISQDNENLKFEITRFQDKLDKIEERSVQDLSSIKRAVAQSAQKIEELEEELSLAHKARHNSSISAQNAITDFRVARQNQESADIKAKELEQRCKDAQTTINELEFKVAQVTDQLSSACLTHSNQDGKIAQLEGQLRGLDKAEAAMISALQAKSFAENRVSKLETDLVTVTRSRDSLQNALNAKDADLKRLSLSKEMAARETTVLRAEVMTLSHAVEERDVRLKEITMTMHAQHNQIVMCAMQQMESTTREQQAQAETVQAHAEIAAMQEALLRAQVEHERVMGLLLTAQERLVAATNEHDTFNSGGDSPTPTPIVSALFQRVSSIHANSVLSNNATASQGNTSNGRSSTPPRTSLFQMPKALGERVVSAINNNNNRESDGNSPLPGDVSSNGRGANTDNQQSFALIEELRRDLREATLARHHADMTSMTLKSELSSTRELLDEYQSRAESKRDYQELMRLRLQFRALEADMAVLTTRCAALEVERDALLLRISASGESVDSEQVVLEVEAVVEPPADIVVFEDENVSEEGGEDMPPTEVETLDQEEEEEEEEEETIAHTSVLLSEVMTEKAVVGDVVDTIESVPVTSVSAADVDSVAELDFLSADTPPEQEVSAVEANFPKEEYSADCVSFAVSTQAIGASVAASEDQHGGAVALEIESSTSATPNLTTEVTPLIVLDNSSVQHSRRFVVSSDHPIVFLDIDANGIQLGVWKAATATLESVFSCPAYVAQVRADADREDVLARLEREAEASVDEQHASSLDPSMCEFFRETGLMVGVEAQHCLAATSPQEQEEDSDSDDAPSSSPAGTLAALFEKGPLLTGEGRLASPLALCYVILHCVLKGLGLEELGDLQLLCRHPGTFTAEDRDTLMHVLFDDLGVGKACLVSDVTLIAESCAKHSEVSETRDMLVIDIGETTTVLIPVTSGCALEDAVVRCEIGARHVAEHLGMLLAPQLAELVSRPAIAQWLSENSARIFRDALNTFRTSRSTCCDFSFPLPSIDGSDATQVVLNVDSLKHNCSPLFFTPTLTASCAAQSSIVTLIAQSMALVGDSAQRADIYRNILLSGQTSLLTDLPARIQSRLQSSSNLSGVDASSQVFSVALEASANDGVNSSSVWRGAAARLARDLRVVGGALNENVLLASDFEE